MASLVLILIGFWIGFNVAKMTLNAATEILFNMGGCLITLLSLFIIFVIVVNIIF